ncbi:hypothetical protein BS47DRAFT_1352382 [Hydnum rufescens UP504]|uniref:Uncharacterized protein n=1 Tax=Hydnum rufescens UP504 TaxID=1448309 RepID=A0A9P6DMG8_9AGAM|nr:hypothetical protein BS47DRAFT_1352382 [Hydnum rufescens UP504]
MDGWTACRHPGGIVCFLCPSLFPSSLWWLWISQLDALSLFNFIPQLIWISRTDLLRRLLVYSCFAYVICVT